MGSQCDGGRRVRQTINQFAVQTKMMLSSSRWFADRLRGKGGGLIGGHLGLRREGSTTKMDEMKGCQRAEEEEATRRELTTRIERELQNRWL